MPLETLGSDLAQADRDLHLGFPFTASDTPALRERMTRDLARIVRAVREHDPAALAVILTGGFSRGEGSAWDDAPLNDYDLVVVRGSPIPRDGLYDKLSHDLEGELGLHVDLLPAWHRRLRRAGAKIFWYETREAGKVIWGPPDLLRTTLPPVAPHAIPREEAVRLLFNRAAGLLLAYPGPGRPFEPRATLIQSSKALLACIEARLLLAGRYHWSARERLLRFDRIVAAEPRLERLLRAAEWATRFKLDPPEGARDVTPEDRWCTAREALLATVDVALRAEGYASAGEYAARGPLRWTERAYHALRTARESRLSLHPRPSLAARHLTHALLTAAEPGTADEAALQEAARRAWFSPDPVPGAWPDLKAAYFTLRGRTLQ